MSVFANPAQGPRPIGGAASWSGADLDKRTDWRWPMVDKGFDTDGETTPALRDLAAGIATSLDQGPGVALLHGFPIDEPNVRRRFLAFTGLLGTHVVQNRASGLIRDIKDNGGSRVESPDRLNFHTDRADIVALLTLQAAASGGISRIVSAVRIHDALLQQRPDLVKVLYEPFYRSSVGDEVGTDAQIYTLPVFLPNKNNFSTDLSRTYIAQAQSFPEVPRMSDAQLEALDAIDQLAEQHCHEHAFEPGDIQLLNNHLIYHARSAFVDDPAGGRRRHLLRIWLATRLGQHMRGEQAALWSSVGLTARQRADSVQMS